MDERSRQAATGPARSGRDRTSTRKKFQFAAITCLLFFGSIEVAARLLTDETQFASRFQQITQIVRFLGTDETDLMLDYDPERFWKLRPNVVILDPDNELWQGVVANSHGFRCNEFELKKQPDTIRIACFGDSSTFGIGTRMEHTWPALLQDLLREEDNGDRFEVVNAGVPGYTSHQGLKHMQQELDRLNPDVVYASYANNDFWRWDGRTDVEHARRMTGFSIGRILRASRGVQLVDHFVSANQSNDKLKWARDASHNYFEPNADWVPRVPIEAFRSNISQMADLCGKRDIPLILVAWPDQPQAAGKWSVRIEYQEVLRDIAAQRGLVIADIAGFFQRNRSWSVRTYIPNDIVHVNRHGNQLAAVAAREALNDTGVPELAAAQDHRRATRSRLVGRVDESPETASRYR